MPPSHSATSLYSLTLTIQQQYTHQTNFLFIVGEFPAEVAECWGEGGTREEVEGAGTPRVD